MMVEGARPGMVHQGAQGVEEKHAQKGEELAGGKGYCRS